MSRPRRPFGANPPGRLAATLLKVLAAEMSEPVRLARGKRYWAQDAVIDIVVGHGAATAEVQGSRRQPYVVTIETAAGQGAPSRRDVRVWCTCPDDEGHGRSACKHAVAALFALSDEVAADPDVLARWRRSDRVPDTSHADDSDGDDSDSATASGAPRTALKAVPVPDPDREIALLLDTPIGVLLPPLPDLAEAPRPALPDPLLSDTLADALEHLRIRWD